MSHSVRRTVLTLTLASLLAAAVRPVPAQDLTTRPRAPVPHVSGVSGTAGAWSWLRQAWLEVSSFLAPPPSPPPACGANPPCQKPDEGPIIDPNGHH